MKYLFFILLLCTSTFIHADPFRDGVVAYQQANYQKALDSWLPLARSGHVLAQTLIGSMYADGEGVKQNDHEAFKWLSRAANSGSAQAQYNLGILYENGFGISANKALARKWFKAAADQGRKDAAARYALLEETATDITPTQETVKIEKKLETQASQTSPNQFEEINVAPAIQDKTPKKRIQIVLNRNNNELLGPPATATESITDYDANEHGLAWARQQPRDNYTIQLASSLEPRLIEAFQKHLKLTKHYAKTISEHNDSQWHALIYGSYASVSDAKKEIDTFPASWKTWQPWIKKFSSINAIKH